MKIRLSLHRKMILLLIPASLLIFAGAISYMIVQARKKAIADTRQIADESAKKYAQLIKAEIDKDFDIARAMSYTFESYDKLDSTWRTTVFNDILGTVVLENPQYVSFWLNFELTFVDKNYVNKPGRARFTFYRDKSGTISYYTDTLDRDIAAINPKAAYQKMKLSKQETLLEPYYFSYTGNTNDQVLETSVCVPLLKNNEFVGLVGSDILLNHFQELLQNESIYGGGYAYFISNQGTLIAFPDEEKIGSNFAEAFPEVNAKYAILKNIQSNRAVSFQAKDIYTHTESYITYIPITMGETVTPWCFAVSVPFSSLKENARKTMLTSLLMGVLGVLLLAFIIYVISRTITNPLKKTTKVLKNIAHGNIDVSKKLNINTGDEIEEMSHSVNQLIDGLSKTADFAKKIGQGILSVDFVKASENDTLGNALLEMRESLKTAAQEEKKRKIADEKTNWATQGLAKFGDILRQHDQDITQLSFSIMSNLVDYVGAIQGALFVKNDDDEDQIVFEMSGAIAYDRQKKRDDKFLLGEGLVGRCAYERLTIYMEEVPEDYVYVTSGLGEANPRSILLVPAVLNDEVYAIIELVSFNKFEPYQIEFVEKIGESIASTISNVRVSDRTNKLLEQSKQQAEELAAQEEEMRQNLEELQATQEEIGRLREEDQQKNQQLINEIEKHKKTLIRILDHLPIKVFVKDAQGKMVIVNKKLLEVHQMELDDIIGKSDFDFFADNYNKAKELWDDEQNIIKSGVPKKEVHIETINDSGVMLDTTKYPFYIDYMEETGILGIQLDITDLENCKERIKQLEEALEKYKNK